MNKIRGRLKQVLSLWNKCLNAFQENPCGVQKSGCWHLQGRRNEICAWEFPLVSFQFYSDILNHSSNDIRILEKPETVKQLIQPGIKKSKKEGINEERKRGFDHRSVQIIMTDFLL
jgi:hypothetical protein